VFFLSSSLKPGTFSSVEAWWVHKLNRIEYLYRARLLFSHLKTSECPFRRGDIWGVHIPFITHGLQPIITCTASPMRTPLGADVLPDVYCTNAMPSTGFGGARGFAANIEEK
jgi:hypothetical protein